MEVLKKEFNLDLDPVTVYSGLDADVLLEKGVRGWKESYVATDPVDKFRYSNGGDDGLLLLEEWLNGFVGKKESEAGAFGYIGYDIAKELEDIPRVERDITLPDIAFNLYDSVIKVRDSSVEIEVLAEHDEVGEETISEIKRSLEDMMQSAVNGSIEATHPRSNFTREEYCSAVETVKEYVRRGETFQANISQRISFSSQSTPLELYKELRRTNPSPYMGLFEVNENQAVISSSPELLVRKEGNRLSTRPIAGTRPRSTNVERDADLRRELRASEKERAEHAMLVDLARNDLGKVSRYGSVEVESFMEAVPYSEVQHLESVVTGELRPNSGQVDIVRALFPGGTVTGAPKPRTLQIIGEVEPVERGPYTGSLGRIAYNGDLTLNILIRTVVKDGRDFHLQVGGGVVHDSDPEKEYMETLHKAEGVLNALDAGIDDIKNTRGPV